MELVFVLFARSRAVSSQLCLHETIDYSECNCFMNIKMKSIMIINVETNFRHANYSAAFLLRENRLCTFCNQNDIEDEFHFILKCPFYSNLRHTYIKPCYYRNPSVFKLVQLLSVQNVKDLRNLGKYLCCA